MNAVNADMINTDGTLVKVEGLKKHFPIGASFFKRVSSHIYAVDGVNFEIEKGKSLGLVGESGCGKTTTGKMLARLHDPTAGHIYVNDTELGQVDLAELKGRDLKTFRRRVQMIFQDPYESLNPRRTIFDTVVEPLAVQGIGDLVERESLASGAFARIAEPVATREDPLARRGRPAR